MSELFVEVLCEELPAAMVRPALDGLRDGLLALLAGVSTGAVRCYATPRRLAVAIADVAEGRPLTERLITGPPADRAFKDGAPTQAAIGFARGKGVDVDAIQVVDGPKGQVIAVAVREGGERAADLLAHGLPGVILGLPFAKSMEWGEGGTRFGRPLHRVNALLDGAPIAAEVAGLAVGHETLGHRLSPLGPLTFDSETTWLDGLRARHVEPDLDARKAQIRALLDEAAQRLGGDRIDDPVLLEEVTHLVEWPTLVIGAFDKDLLNLPHRLLVESMKSHQRYFPVHRGGELTHHFVVISNNPWGDEKLVAEGNARVLRARFYDARFFLAEDRKHSLAEHGKKLERMQWIRGLGSMADKQARVARLAAVVARTVGADPEVAGRAGALCKSDLTTQMVGEFPELQGHMGRLYARGGGESEAVAVAIEESWLPRGAFVEVPETLEGTAVALADRLDTLVGCFGIGQIPTGGGDVLGLRRAAMGIVAIDRRHALRLDLNALFAAAIENFHAGANDGDDRFGKWIVARGDDAVARDADTLSDELVAFTLARLKAMLVGEGASADRVDAVLAVGAPEPLTLWNKVKALEAIAGTDEFEQVMRTFKRVLNITVGLDVSPVAPDHLVEPAEKDLGAAIADVAGAVEAAEAELDYSAMLRAMLALQAPVAAFFDAVLVDDPDPAIKARRIGLLGQCTRVFRRLADFSRISTR